MQIQAGEFRLCHVAKNCEWNKWVKQLGELEISNYQTQSETNTEAGADYLHLVPLNEGDKEFMKGQRTFRM